MDIEEQLYVSKPDSPFEMFCLEALQGLTDIPSFKPSEPNPEIKVKFSTGCNCSKTKCLKLYCECFSNGNMCSKSCKCKNCNNTETFVGRNKAVSSILERNPFAFEHSRLTGTRGCNCRMSGCKKKYCECFLNGIECTALCGCQKCKNINDKIKH